MISTSNGTLFLFLMKTGEFNSKIGRMIIATTIADDVVGILFLSFFSFYIKSNVIALNTVFNLFLISIGFYLVMFTAGSKIVNALLNVAGKFLDTNALFTVPVAFAFMLAYVTDNIGLSIAAGAFLAGMAIANSQYSENVISPKVITIANGFFVPVFYAAVGSALVLANLNYLLIAALILAAIFGKVIGVGLTSRYFGIRGRSARLFDIIMTPRGNENIAIVQIVLLLGVITFQIYTSIIFAMVATVLLTPVLLKVFYKR
jgi:Kef-type K+ transport system membrane component KefB